MTKQEDIDFYKLLGIRKNASADSIKKAYRKKAFENHPDRNGDPDLFKLIKLAYEVLSNLERRERYDRTGDWTETEVDNTHVRPMQILSQALTDILTQMLEYNKDLKYEDLVPPIRGAMEHRIKELVAEQKTVDNVREKLKTARGRWVAAEGVDNILDRTIEIDIEKLGQRLDVLTHDIKDHKAAIELLTKFKYTFEKKKYNDFGGWASIGVTEWKYNVKSPFDKTKEEGEKT